MMIVITMVIMISIIIIFVFMIQLVVMLSIFTTTIMLVNYVGFVPASLLLQGTALPPRGSEGTGCDVKRDGHETTNGFRVYDFNV